MPARAPIAGRKTASPASATITSAYVLLSPSGTARDPILKERLFGVSGPEGNHGEDVKEYYYYLDSTPTHSYMKACTNIRSRRFPTRTLVEINRARSRAESEYELIDTGIFNENRYFDIFIEYAKNDVDDILVRATVINRGPSPASLHLLPTVWFRNTWSWGYGTPRPELSRLDTHTIGIHEQSLGDFKLWLEDAPPLLFTENESNTHAPVGLRQRAAVYQGRISSLSDPGRPERREPR